MIENKNTDVELDTDGIEEQSIQVENKKQENELCYSFIFLNRINKIKVRCFSD